jgi:hypothetical protein
MHSSKHIIYVGKFVYTYLFFGGIDLGSNVGIGGGLRRR